MSGRNSWIIIKWRGGGLDCFEIKGGQKPNTMVLDCMRKGSTIGLTLANNGGMVFLCSSDISAIKVSTVSPKLKRVTADPFRHRKISVNPLEDPDHYDNPTN